MLRRLWQDDTGEIGEYALIVAAVLLLGVGVMNYMSKSVNRVNQTVVLSMQNAGKMARR